MNITNSVSKPYKGFINKVFLKINNAFRRFCLRKDVFEKEVVKTEEKVMHEGDKYIKSVQDLRLDNNGQHVPNSAGMLKSDMNTGTGHRYEFAPEDIKKMFSMSEDEMIKYREQLIAEKKYIKEL